MNRVTRYLLPLMCLSAITGVSAEENGHWYVGVHYNPLMELSDTEITVINPGTAGGAIPIGNLSGQPDAEALFATATPASIDNADVEFDNGEGYGIVLGYDFKGLLRTELDFRQYINDVDSIGGVALDDEEIKSVSVMANFWMDFNRDGYLRPYLGVGVGGAEVDFGDHDKEVVMAQAGAGFNWHMTKHWVLDLGYRYFGTDKPGFKEGNGFEYDMDYRGQTLLLGLKFNYGFADEPKKALAPVMIADSDGDGVSDDKDKCPGTPPGATVNADGCADSDGDGVIDSRDNCPNTPRGVPVNENGCSDSDGDGIIDRVDACPNSPAGQPVLSNGCGASQSTILQGVNFQLNSAELTSSAQRILEDVASALLDSTGYTVELQGHTDSLGREEYNRELSQRRADSVKVFLVGRGVEPDRLIAKGYGEISPIADNSSAEGRATNRRVELKVIDIQP